MKLTTALVVALFALTAGCASQPEAEQASEVAVVEAAITAAQCDTELNRCLSGPLGWLFGAGCRAQHATCLATATLPEPVQDAIESAAECTAEAVACLDGANAAEAVACGVEEAECLAEVLDVTVDIDGTITGAAECAADTVACIESSETGPTTRALCDGDGSRSRGRRRRDRSVSRPCATASCRVRCVTCLNPSGRRSFAPRVSGFGRVARARTRFGASRLCCEMATCGSWMPTSKATTTGSITVGC